MKIIKIIVVEYLKKINKMEYDYLLTGRYENCIKLECLRFIIIYFPIFKKESNEDIYKFILEEKFNQIVSDIDFKIEEISLKKIEVNNNNVKLNNIAYYQIVSENKAERHLIDDYKNKRYIEMIKYEYLKYKNKNQYYRQKLKRTYLESYSFSDIITKKDIIKAMLWKLIKNTDEKYSQYMQMYQLDKIDLRRCDIIYEINNDMVDKKKISDMITTILHLLQMEYLKERIILKTDLKTTRPFCIRKEAPDMSYAVINLCGGSLDIINVLHEIGHLVYDEKHRGVPRAEWYFKDKIRDEAIAIFIEYLATNKGFLEQFLSSSLAEIISKKNEFEELLSLRKYCGLLLYEIRIIGENQEIVNLEECKRIYKDIFEQVYKCTVNSNECMHIIEPYVGSYTYLVANIMAKKYADFLCMDSDLSKNLKPNVIHKFIDQINTERIDYETFTI